MRLGLMGLIFIIKSLGIQTHTSRNIKSPKTIFIRCASSFHAIMTSLCFRLTMHYVFLFGDFFWVHLFGGCKLGFLRKGSLLVIPQTSLIGSMLLHTEQVTKIFKIWKLNLPLHMFFVVILFEIFKLNLKRFVIIH